MINPCVSNCCLDHDEVCLGCFRTLNEILQWTLLDEPQQQAILLKTAVRKELHAARRTAFSEHKKGAI